MAISGKSEALIPDTNLLLAAARALGLLKKPPVAAVHEFVLQVREGGGKGPASWLAVLSAGRSCGMLPAGGSPAV